ncbi:MAG: RbsD/FucU domain-containing protein [Anaerolineaceae bacterium]|nr:RbsD/FucU domain-containing protein [Anaerolineaceae bacterium]
MLKGIDKAISPDMIKVLMEMGHGDELVIADGNFPAASLAQRIIWGGDIKVSTILDSILKLFPLDQYVEHPVVLMSVVPGDPYVPTVWEGFYKVVKAHESGFDSFEWIDRYSFYERTSRAYAVITTTDLSLYANIILKKGVITDH